MSRVLASFAFGICALLTVTQTVWANESLRELAQRLTISEHSSTRHPGLCSTMLSDLKAWRNVELIQPLSAAQSLERLNAIGLKACDLEELVTSYSIEPRVWRENNLDALSPREREDYGIPYMMTKDFRLYRANIDFNPETKELVLYGAGVVVRGTDDRSSDLTYFHVIDARQCAVRNSAQVVDTARYPKSVVGLLRHKERTYAFDTRHFPQESLFWVRLQRWTYSRVTELEFFSTACSYIAHDK